MGGSTPIVRLTALSQSVPAEHYLQYLWDFEKNWKVKAWVKSPPLPQPAERYTESGLDMKSYFYSSVDTLAWLTVLMEAWVSSSITHDQNWRYGLYKSYK